MLVLGEAFEFAGGRFENVGRRGAPPGHAPALGVRIEKEGCLRLGSRKAELPLVTRGAGGTGVLHEQTQALGELFFREPMNTGGFGFGQKIGPPLGTNKLHGARAILAHMGNQLERIAR